MKSLAADPSNKAETAQTIPMRNNKEALKKIEKAYDSAPWWYDIRGFFILKLSYRGTLLSQIRFFARNISPNHLEVAVGTGSLLEMVLRWRRMTRGPTGTITAFDYAEPMLDGAHRKFKHNKNIRLSREDVSELPYPDNSFESANIANAVHCFPDVDKGLREIYRVLKPDATIAVNILLFAEGRGPLRRTADRIAEWGIKKGILETPYHREDIENRFRNAGFTISSSERTGNVLMLTARK